MKSMRLAILIVIALATLSACGPQTSLTRGAIIKPDRQQAYVIVGAIGNETVISLNTSTGYYSIAGGRLSDDVHVFPVNVGQTFSITRVYVRPRYYRSTRFANIRRPHSLYIDRPGIYYFGTIYTRFGKLYIGKRVSRLMVRRAERKFPQLFRVKQPVNF